MHNGNPNAGDTTSNSKDKKTQEPLFGPNIGVVSSGPAWATTTEKKVLTDELTPDIVNSWIEKSKDVCPDLHATHRILRPRLITSINKFSDHDLLGISANNNTPSTR